MLQGPPNQMDSMLCDELMIEIFHRLPPSSAVWVVSKRWLRLFRHSKTSLSLLLPPPLPPHHGGAHHHLSVSSLISQYPFLSSLSLSSTSSSSPPLTSTLDSLLLSASSSCPNLRNLRFLAGPVSLSSLYSLSSTIPNLTSLTVPLSRPLNFSWLPLLHSLSSLSVVISGETPGVDFEGFEAELKVESLSVSGLSWCDLGMGWLWRNCVNLKNLHLRSCEGVGDGGSYFSFSQCLRNLTSVELRSCRTISDMVLLKLAENSIRLNSLLVYDGGSKDGLMRFINNCNSDLKTLDLRLPLDLNNEHLSAMAENVRTLKSLRLQSCCLVTGDGLKTFSQSLRSDLEELALINCDVVERVPGLLANLGQNLKGLKKLDLSHNETLGDKELVSMLVSCEGVVDLRLKGCKGLTNMAMMGVIRVCRNLQSLDVLQCGGIDDEGVESLVLNLKRLKKVKVEETKLSNVVMNWVSNRFIQVGV